MYLYKTIEGRRRWGKIWENKLRSELFHNSYGKSCINGSDLRERRSPCRRERMVHLELVIKQFVVYLNDGNSELFPKRRPALPKPINASQLSTMISAGDVRITSRRKILNCLFSALLKGGRPR